MKQPIEQLYDALRKDGIKHFREWESSYEMLAKYYTNVDLYIKGELTTPEIPELKHHQLYMKIRPLEHYITCFPSLAYFYANWVLKRRWPEAEPYIMTNASAAVFYAYELIKEPWSEAEQYIMNDSDAAVCYSMLVLKRRWLEAEPFIKQKYKWCKNIRYYNSAYCKHFGIEKL